jgi:hypothetical protein
MGIVSDHWVLIEQEKSGCRVNIFFGYISQIKNQKVEIPIKIRQ